MAAQLSSFPKPGNLEIPEPLIDPNDDASGFDARRSESEDSDDEAAPAAAPAAAAAPAIDPRALWVPARLDFAEHFSTIE